MLCLFILAFAGSAEADDTFSARGQVIDANGNPVPGADVSMVNLAYRTIALTKTDANGNFTFDNIDKQGNVVKIVVSYTDKSGVTYSMPPEFGMWFTANGTTEVNRNATRISDYPPAVQPTGIPPVQPKAPINAGPMAIALVLGIVMLAGVYWLMKRQ